MTFIAMPPPPRSADADAGRGRRAAAGADPARAAVVALGLLGHGLLESAHQLVDVEVLEGAAQLLGELLHRMRIGEPSSSSGGSSIAPSMPSK